MKSQEIAFYNCLILGTLALVSGFSDAIFFAISAYFFIGAYGKVAVGLTQNPCQKKEIVL